VYLLAPEPLPDTSLLNKLRQTQNVEIAERVVVKEITGERIDGRPAQSLDGRQ